MYCCLISSILLVFEKLSIYPDFQCIQRNVKQCGNTWNFEIISEYSALGDVIPSECSVSIILLFLVIQYQVIPLCLNIQYQVIIMYEYSIPGDIVSQYSIPDFIIVSEYSVVGCIIVSEFVVMRLLSQCIAS